MTPCQIAPLSFSDARALARNNMSAFWEDPNWNILWPKTITLPSLIVQAALRYPRNLLNDPTVFRHEKAVDPETGELVGYARWKLPQDKRFVTNERGRQEAAWKEAQLDDPSPTERKQYQDMAAGAWWEPRTDMDLDDANHAVEDRILAEKPYLSESPRARS